MRKNKRKGKNMADTNENKVLDSENKTLDEKQTAPVAAKLTDTAEIISPGKQAQSETLDKDHDENATPLEADALLVPYTAGGRKEQIVAQDTAVQAPAADDKLKKEQKELLKSLDSKADDFAKKNPALKKKAAPAKTKAEKSAKAEKPPKAPKEKKTANIGGGGIGGTSGKSEQTATKEAAPVVPEPPRAAKRPGGKETIVYIDHADLHPFKNHPFQVRDDDAMKGLVDSIKERGVDQAAIVRPREEGGYEIVAGHRRQHASELAGIKNIPCVVRNMTDEEAILAMTESNFTYRTEILASERAQALKMQLDAIKRQGERFSGVASGDVGKRSI